MIRARYKIGGLLILGLILILCAFAFSGFGEMMFSSAEEVSKFYYSQLNYTAKQFYKAIENMEKTGVLKQGREFDLLENDILKNEDISAYENGSSTLLRAFGAGRDAYILDNPDVFYVDFSQLSIRIGTKLVDGEKTYTAFLGRGGNDSYLIDSTLSQTQIDAQIVTYEEKINEIVTEASLKETIEEKIEFVNEKIISLNEYSFETTVDSEGVTSSTEFAPYVNTAYGAVVNNKSTSEGYSKLFKSVMDKLNIQCEIVHGYRVAGNDLDGNLTFEKYMWNYVKIDEHWYGIDVARNDTDKNAYTLFGNQQMKIDYILDGVMSSSNFSFNYPRLHDYDYKFENNDGLSIIKYSQDVGTDNEKMIVNVSYNNKASKELEEMGLYLIVRTGNYDSNNELVWDRWVSVSRGQEVDANTFVDKTNFTETRIDVSNNVVQFAVVRNEPNFNPTRIVSYVYYSDDTVFDYVAISNEITNILQVDGYTQPPYVDFFSPSDNVTHDANKTYNVEITYSESLKRKVAGEDIGVEVISTFGDLSDYIILKDFNWSENEPNKVTFNFRGSLMKEHNQTTYLFRLINLVGEGSEKTPITAILREENLPSFQGRYYQDRPLHLELLNQPTLVGSDDLSLKGWKYESGNFVAENLKNQLILVNKIPNDVQSNEMTEKVSGEILSSQTYEIDLQHCGQAVVLPNDSHVKLGFNLPNGYEYNREGITYKVYHFSQDDNGVIITAEELDCVIAEYGLIVNASDLGLFAVVAVNGNQTGKAVLLDGVGLGEVTAFSSGGQTLTRSGVIKTQEGQTVTFTLTPAENQEIEVVLLNGHKVDEENGTLTLTYEQLGDNNIIEVLFSNSSVISDEEEKGIEKLNPVLKVVDGIGELSVSISTQAKNIEKGGTAILSAYTGINGNLSNKQGKFTYQWYKDGEKLEGETNGFLRIDNFNSDDAGKYTVEAIYTVEMRSKSVKSESMTLNVESINYVQLVFGLVIALVTVIMCVVLFTSNRQSKTKGAK